MMKLFALVGLFVSVSANAAFFSLAGIVDQSDSFSVSVNGVTMTIDNPSPFGLANFPDGVVGLDFGDGRPIVGEPYLLNSFDVSFTQAMLLTSLENPTNFGILQYSILGDGVASTGNILSNDTFNGGPLLFKAGERYTFSREISGFNAGVIFGIYASPVPIPAAAWLFGSALLSLVALKRKKA